MAVNRLLLAMLLCAACATPTTPPPAKVPGAGGDLMIQVVRLENTQAGDVAKAFESSLASQSTSGVALKVAVAHDQNALVFSGTAVQIQEALRVVAKLDSLPGR